MAARAALEFGEHVAGIGGLGLVQIEPRKDEVFDGAEHIERGRRKAHGRGTKAHFLAGADAVGNGFVDLAIAGADGRVEHGFGG